MIPGNRLKRRVYTGVFPLVLPMIFIILWKFLSWRLNNPVVLPPPERVALLLLSPHKDLIGMGPLVKNLAISLLRVMGGYSLAVVLGVSLGVLMGFYPCFFTFSNFFLSLFRPIAPLAWVPLVLAWFGVASLAHLMGVEGGPAYFWLGNIKISMLFVIFIAGFFPILTSSIHAIQSVPQPLLDAVLVLGATEKDLFFKVLLPAASPHIVNGMRIGLGIAWMSLVSAEMLPGSIAGMGYLIMHAYTLGRTDVVMMGMVCIGLVGALMDFLFRHFAEKRYHWFYREV